MKMKLFAVAVTLSLLLSMMVITVGGEATTGVEVKEVNENIESESEPQDLADSSWPSFGRDRKNTGRSPYDTSRVDGTGKWDFETGDWVWSSPAIGEDGTVYVGSLDGNLYAVNPDGTERWSFVTDDSVYSSPAIDENGTIYVGSEDDNLYAVNPDGTERWSFGTGDLVTSSPSIGEDGNIYVGSYDNYLYALNPDGTERWSFETGSAVRSSPAIGEDGTIYIGSQDSNLYAVNPDGTERWSFGTGGAVRSSPAIGEDGTIYIGSHDSNLYAVNTDGTERWSFKTGDSVTSSPSIGEDGTIYVSSVDNHLYALNPDGTERWNFETGYSVYSSPVIGEDGTIYIGSYDNHLYAVSSDGPERWSFNAGYSVYSSPAIGEDGTLYVGSRNHRLYAIGEEKEHDLTINIVGEGSTEPSEGTHTYEEGEEVTITTTPAEGWYFEEWSGDHIGTSDEITVPMDSDKEITARFAKEELEPAYFAVAIIGFDDEVQKGERITVNFAVTNTGEEEGTQEIAIYVNGEEVKVYEDEITLGPGESYSGEITFDAEEIGEGVHELEVRSNDEASESVSVDVLADDYQLTLDIKGEGSVEIYPDQEEYQEGTDVTLTADPDEGWGFDEWIGADGTEKEITITIDEDKEIKAVFEEDKEDNGETPTDVDEDEEDDDPGFLSDYWWLITFIVIAAVIAFVIGMVWSKKKTSQQSSQQMQDPPPPGGS